MSSLPQGLLDRLVCAKYLQLRAAQVLEEGGTYSGGMAVLGFQDAAEMLLRVIAEHLGASVPEHIAFNALIDLIDKNPLGLKVTQRTSLNRLNRARVSFKHAGIKPDPDDCNEFRQTVEVFGRVALQSFLGVNYDELSLTQLVTHVRTRNHLSQAEKNIEEGAPKDSVQESAIALGLYRSHVRKREGRALSGRTPLRFDLTQTEALSNALREVAERFEWIEDTIELLTDCINPARFARFERLAPNVAVTIGSVPLVVWKRGYPERLSRADAEFCFRFVLDSVLEMQRRRIDHPFEEFTIPPDRPFTVVKPGRIFAFLGDEPELIREAQVGEILQGHFAKYDSPTHIAVIQDGDQAYISRDEVISATGSSLGAVSE